MRDFLLVVATFIVVAVGMSAIAWPLYALLPPMPSLEFDKFCKWLTLLAVAIATLGVLKSRGRLHYRSLGFTPPPRPPLYLLGNGLAIGFVVLTTLGATLYLLDIRTADADVSLSDSALRLILAVLPAALAASLIEEVYFRGIQFGTLIRERRIVAAIILPAAFYAGIHFLNPQEAIAVENPDWFYGTTLLLAAPAQICSETDCIGTGATLFMAGVLLALVRAGGGHLITCIGIHAGWIVSIKLTKDLTHFHYDADLAFLANGYDHFTGILAALWLTVPCAGLIQRLIKNA